MKTRTKVCKGENKGKNIDGDLVEDRWWEGREKNDSSELVPYPVMDKLGKGTKQVKKMRR